MTKYNLLLILVILSTLISFCSPARNKTQTVTPTTTLLMATTISPSKVPVLTATHTSWPSATPQPPEPTFPPGPTLTTEESQREIARLMSKSSNCSFPCWWGIIPGQTSRLYAIATMTHLNLEWSSFELPEGTEYGGPFVKDGDFSKATVGFTINNKIVDDIHIHGVGTYDPAFTKRWERYSFTEILKSYGYPSRFWVFVADDGEKKSYHLWLFYDELKSLIIYAGSSSSYTLCPDFSKGQIDWLDIYLQTPNKSRNLTDITNVYKRIELLDQPDVNLVEKMNDARIKELYDLFTQNKEAACFDISRN